MLRPTLDVTGGQKDGPGALRRGRTARPVAARSGSRALRSRGASCTPSRPGTRCRASAGRGRCCAHIETPASAGSSRASTLCAHSPLTRRQGGSATRAGLRIYCPWCGPDVLLHNRPVSARAHSDGSAASSAAPTRAPARATRMGRSALARPYPSSPGKPRAPCRAMAGGGPAPSTHPSPAAVAVARLEERAAPSSSGQRAEPPAQPPQLGRRGATARRAAAAPPPQRGHVTVAAAAAASDTAGALAAARSLRARSALALQRASAAS
jgi:hypothetical protein